MNWVQASISELRQLQGRMRRYQIERLSAAIARNDAAAIRRSLTRLNSGDQSAVCNSVGVLASYRGDYRLAVSCFCEALIKQPSNAHAMTNLSFLTSASNGEVLARTAYDELSHAGYFDGGATDVSPPALFFRANLELAADVPPPHALGVAHVERMVTSYAKRVPGVRGGHSVFFWHIPKCAGSSFCRGIANAVYDKPLQDVLPGYAHRRLLLYLLRRLRLPFVSSNHLHWTVFEGVERERQYVLLRDPVKRVVSMYRQLDAGVRRGRKLDVLPSYNMERLAPYPILSLTQWLMLTSRVDICGQLATFSGKLDVDEALERLGSLDKVVFVESGVRQLVSSVEGTGILDAPVELPSRLNASPKQLQLSSVELEQLTAKLEPEIEFIGRARDLSPDPAVSRG